MNNPTTSFDGNDLRIFEAAVKAFTRLCIKRKNFIRNSVKIT